MANVNQECRENAKENATRQNEKKIKEVKRSRTNVNEK